MAEGSAPAVGVGVASDPSVRRVAVRRVAAALGGIVICSAGKTPSASCYFVGDVVEVFLSALTRWFQEKNEVRPILLVGGSLGELFE